MTKIIFYTINGVGLGHVMRGINIANALRKVMDCRIRFVTNTWFTDFFKLNQFEFIKGGIDPVELYKKTVHSEEYKKVNQEFLLKQIREFKPEIVVFDFAIMPEVLSYCKKEGIFLAYVIREVNSFNYFIPYRDNLASFDLVLVTCVNSKGFIERIKSSGFVPENVFYVGNIFREPQKRLSLELKKKYSKKNGELLITVVAGGGGYPDERKKFFLYVGVVAKRLAAMSRATKLRWIVLKGPLFVHSGVPFGNMQVYDHEIHLPELFSISDLVVSAGGYNSVNEIIASKAPAILYALNMNVDSQKMRLAAYKSKGFIKVTDFSDLNQAVKLFHSVLNPETLRKMKDSYHKYEHKNGAFLAAGLIKEHFLSFSNKNPVLAVLRNRIDTVGNFFIFDEIERLKRFKAAYLCGEVKNLEDKRIEYYCYPFSRIAYRDRKISVLSRQGISAAENCLFRIQARIIYAEFMTDCLPFWAVIKKMNLPLVMNFRGFELSDPTLQEMLPLLNSRADLIIARSISQRKELISLGLLPSKIKVIYTGVDAENIPFSLRKFRQGRIKLLSAGRFVEKKGFDVTLRAFQEILKIFPFSELTLIGEGELYDAIEKQVRDARLLKKVTIKKFLPHREFIKELYGHDIFILSSRVASGGDKEGIPNVLKEAMASGMPVISTYHSGIPELIKDQDTGFLVKENDYYEISDKVRFILNNQEKTFHICRKARDFVVKHFDVNKNARKVEVLFNDLLSKKRVQ